MEKHSILDLIKEARPEIRASTLKSYYYGIRRAMPEKSVKRLGVGMSENRVSMAWMSNFKDVLSRLEAVPYTVAVTKTTLTPLLVISKHLFGGDSDTYAGYLAESERLGDILCKEQMAHEKTAPMEKNWIELDELRTFVLAMPTATAKQKIRRLIGALYVLHPPARNDYSSMQLIDSDEDIDDTTNYLVLKDGVPDHFLFQSYKTSKKYGLVTVPIGVELRTELQSFLGERKTGLMFGKKMNKSAVSYAMSQAFTPLGKHVTVNTLRHIVTTDSIDLDTRLQQKKLAEAMMHSSDQQLCYAKK